MEHAIKLKDVKKGLAKSKKEGNSSRMQEAATVNQNSTAEY